MLHRSPAHFLQAELLTFLFLIAGCIGLPARQRYKLPAGSSASFAVATTALHTGNIHEAYEGVIKVAGGAPLFARSFVSRDFPPGLSPGHSTGRIAGKPSRGGKHSLAIAVTDSSRTKSTKTFDVIIADQLLDRNGGPANMRPPHGGTRYFRLRS